MLLPHLREYCGTSMSMIMNMSNIYPPVEWKEWHFEYWMQTMMMVWQWIYCTLTYGSAERVESLQIDGTQSSWLGQIIPLPTCASSSLSLPVCNTINGMILMNWAGGQDFALCFIETFCSFVTGQKFLYRTQALKPAAAKFLYRTQAKKPAAAKLSKNFVFYDPAASSLWTKDTVIIWEQ